LPFLIYRNVAGLDYMQVNIKGVTATQTSEMANGKWQMENI
jgi:hypothetical protein